MRQFRVLLEFGIHRRSRDFFVIFYNIIFPVIAILLLGYLSSKSYSAQFTSYHYYTIVMIPFCVLMGIITVSYTAQEEQRLKTACRYIVAPVSKQALILAKFISCVLTFSSCGIATLLISKLLFHMNYNGRLLWIVLLIVCESSAIAGIGLFLGLACKRFELLRNFLNLPIVVFGFLGSTFFPVHSFHPILSILIHLSPLTWINQGITACIFDNNLRIITIVSLVSLFIGFAATALTIQFFRKEAFV